MNQSIQEKLLSVFIPNYNQDASVVRAVESIGMHDNDDIEIIVVDDCSEIAKFNNLESGLMKFRNVRLYRNESNLGLVRNWNMCISKCSGEWMGMICCDDEYVNGAVHRIYNILKTVKKPSLLIQDSSINNEIEYVQGGNLTAKNLKLPIVSGNFWHKKIIEHLGGFDVRLKYSPDAEFWYRIAAQYPVIKIKHKTAIYHMHTGNYMWNTWRQADFIDQIELLIDLVTPYKYPDTSESQKKEITREGVRQTINTILKYTIGKNDKKDIFKQYFKMAWDYADSWQLKCSLIRHLISAFKKKIKDDIKQKIANRFA